MSTIYFHGAVQYSPDGSPYPRMLSLPTTTKPLRLYAPRLRYFQSAFGLRDNSSNDPNSYLLRLGKIPINYCGQYNSGVYCNPGPCIYHHLCEWCAGPHPGNMCPYRPSFIRLRQPNPNKEVNHYKNK